MLAVGVLSITAKVAMTAVAFLSGLCGRGVGRESRWELEIAFCRFFAEMWRAREGSVILGNVTMS